MKVREIKKTVCASLGGSLNVIINASHPYYDKTDHKGPTFKHLIDNGMKRSLVLKEEAYSPHKFTISFHDVNPYTYCPVPSVKFI